VNYEIIKEPEAFFDSGWTYWQWRKGGYNPEDGSYGRAATKEDAERLIRGHQANDLATRSTA